MESRTVLVPLTLKLIAVPELAWPRLTAAEARGEDLPAPLNHAGVVAGASILVTLIGAALKVERSLGGVMLAFVLAVLGYAGSAVASVWLAPRLIRTHPGTQALVPRYASACAIPAIASGAINIVPLDAVVMLGALFGAAASYRSGSLGARDFLGMEGASRRQTTLIIAALASTPIVLSALLRLAL